MLPPRLPLQWWSCGCLQSQCGGVRKAVKPEISLLVLEQHILENLGREQLSQSGHGKNLYSFTAQRPLDERAYFIDFMLSLLPE